ncbi:MAG: tetratricopeptide repeat protein [Usitatibacter sp.]
MRLTAHIAACIALAFAGPTAVLGAPRVPADDHEVLERLPGRAGDAGARQAAALREALAREPANLGLALRAAQVHIARGRSESDPRQFGQAQAALSPWWSQPEPPVAVLVLRATLRQNAHQFASAREDLAQAVRRDPRNAQAWLTLATVQQVMGDLDGARQSCTRLEPLVADPIAAICTASIDGVSGRAGPALESVEQALARSARVDPHVRGWALSLQAELAERMGREQEAERLWRVALALDPSDTYAAAGLADFLLDRNRHDEVAALIPAGTPSDPLLLRRVLAVRRQGQAGAASETESLASRFAASRARGDRVHLREEARFALEVRGDARAARELAAENWKNQKEAADARIALEAALAAGEPASAGEVLAWIEAHGLEGDRIAALRARLAKARRA